MRNRVALVTAIVAFAVLVAGLAVLADGADDKSAGELARLRYASTGERNATATDAAAPDIASYPYGTDYRLAGPVPKPAEQAKAYRITRPAKADAERLARALGLGALTSEGEAWTAAGKGVQLRVEQETGWWYYGLGPDTAVSSPPAKDDIGGCAPCPPDQICTMECRPVRPRPALPSKDDAERQARAFWQKIGVVPGDAKVDVHEGYDDVQVVFGLRVGGHEIVGRQETVAVGAKGDIVHAAGWMGGQKAVGDYPLIDPAEAVKRLNQPDGGRPAVSDGTPPPGAEPMPARDLPADAGATVPGHPGSPEPDRPATSEPGSPGGAGSSTPGSGPSGKPSPDSPPVTIEPLPAPKTAVVTLVGVRLAYEFTGSHLLPVYVFDIQGGGQTPPVPAVADAHIAVPAQAEMLTD